MRLSSEGSRRISIAELTALDERMLADIGPSPYAIEYAVHHGRWPSREPGW
ncbi:MAG TPA: DUF1127 domain-containing protein [Sphingomonas sp.]|nr:DUF1127 domain-containing protein [Sphingomonas sp.]